VFLKAGRVVLAPDIKKMIIHKKIISNKTYVIEKLIISLTGRFSHGRSHIRTCLFSNAHARLLGACTYVNDAMALNRILKLNIQAVFY